jgi:hypothetical protein
MIARQSLSEFSPWRRICRSSASANVSGLLVFGQSGFAGPTCISRQRDSLAACVDCFLFWTRLFRFDVLELTAIFFSSGSLGQGRQNQDNLAASARHLFRTRMKLG